MMKTRVVGLLADEGTATIRFWHFNAIVVC